MLIQCERHTADDLALWREIEEADLVWYETHDMDRREASAIDEIRRFSARDFFVGVSWGKDSVVVLDLAVRAVGSVRAVCARGTYRTVAVNQPYLDAVRDAFLSPRFRVSYEEVFYPETPPHSKERVLAAVGNRYVSGVRQAESGKRRISRRFHGVSTERTCRPIIDWPTDAVFGYLTHHNLPVHPNYGMLGGGRWNRARIRVGGSIGGTDGDGMGRNEWEREYYRDVLARIRATTA